MEIKCPKCNRKAKFKECICKTQGRKRVVLDFPCHHFACLIYNVPNSTDDNTIIKDFNTISEEYFAKTYFLSHFGERHLKEKENK